MFSCRICVQLSIICSLVVSVFSSVIYVLLSYLCSAQYYTFSCRICNGILVIVGVRYYATWGDSLTSELPTCLPIYLDRLKNEITRLTAVKALIMIAGSPLRIDLSLLLNEAMPLMAGFLRKNHRGLKLSTLTCLDILILNYGNCNFYICCIKSICNSCFLNIFTVTIIWIWFHIHLCPTHLVEGLNTLNSYCVHLFNQLSWC